MPFPLSLQPAVPADRDAEPLFTVLQKIYAERGHLRDVTEESLEAEIESSRANVASETQSSDEDFDEHNNGRPSDVESRVKELQAARTDMLQLIGQANNEALTALDFVSLLLSKDAPRQAEASISPALKSMAPSGTLGFDKTETSKNTSTDQAKDKTAALGFNFDSLNSAADKLLESASQLETEIHRETKFWEQILSVSEKGWNLCRVPGRSHTVGVRFGFSEASPRFRARGLAPLKPDLDGSVVLDQTVSEAQKILRVRIADGDAIIETSMNTPLLGSSDKSLDSMVHRARDSLFDEELYFNLLVETRELFSHGVRIVDGQIVLPVGTTTHPDRKILLDLVSQNAKASTGESLADSVALVLRLFLTNLYRNRHRQRSSSPPPLNAKNRQWSSLNILQSLLSHVQHFVRTNELRDSLMVMSQSVSSAGLDCSIATNHHFVKQMKSDAKTSEKRNTNLTDMEHLMEMLDNSLSTSLTLSLLNSTKILVTINTDLSAPRFGTKYDLAQQEHRSGGETKIMTFTDHEQLIEYITVLVRHSIANHLAQNIEGWSLETDGLAIKHSKSTTAEIMAVLLSRDRLALIRRKEEPDSTSTLVGVWGRKSTPNSLLETARRAAVQ